MRSRDQEKQALVKQKTMELVVKDGLEGFSVNRVARACNISVRTIYIYYADSTAMLIQIAKEETERMESVLVHDFDPAQSFEAGLWWMWQSRAAYIMANQVAFRFIDILRNSSFGVVLFKETTNRFSGMLEKFYKKAVEDGQITPFSFELFWALGFSPLHTLIQLHQASESAKGAKGFLLTEKLMTSAFKKVVAGLKS
jgi:TetR/AcrR family transcriptional regulator, multidrug resistance operon repressor